MIGAEDTPRRELVAHSAVTREGRESKILIHFLYTPYSKMATILVVFCLPSN